MKGRAVGFGVLLALGAIFISIAGCASDIKVPVVGVKVNPQSIIFFGTGGSQTVTATIVPINASDKLIYWESTDPSIASVDANGSVTARAVGYGVFITAYTHDGNYQASCDVQVNP